MATTDPQESGSHLSLPWLGRLDRLFARAVLGLFILWQATFLLVGNFFDYVRDAQANDYWTWEKFAPADPELKAKLTQWLELNPKNPERLDRTSAAVLRLRRTIDHWARLSNQEQGWSLFAPTVADFTCFIAVEIRWDGDDLPALHLGQHLPPIGLPSPMAIATAAMAQQQHARPAPVFLLSDNEPQDHSAYLRLGKFRLRRYEGQLELPLRLHGWTYEQAVRSVPADDYVGWDTKIRDHVWKEKLEIRAYLRYRMHKYLEEHPGLPMPTQVRLVNRTFTLTAPDSPRPFRWTWHPDEMNVPIARWLPWRKQPPYPVEYYNPVTRSFEDY